MVLITAPREPLFVVGTSVAAGLHGVCPNLHDLDDNDDLTFTTDFRGIYAAVLKDHLRVNPTPVLAGTYECGDGILQPGG